MHNAIDVALKRIMHQIPPEILNLAFASGNPMYGGSSIHASIISNVIKGRVLSDCNLVGGRTISITLDSSWVEPTVRNDSEYYAGVGTNSIYRIPAHARDNADIVQVHHVGQPMPFNGGMQIQDARSASICGYLNDLKSTWNGGGMGGSPIPEVLQGDLIRLHPGHMSHIPWVLVCRIAYDGDFNNLNIGAINKLGNLAVIATKMYVHTTTIVKLDRGYISGGAEIGIIREIISGWGDLEELYQEHLLKFTGSNALDIQRVAPLLKNMI